MKCIKNEIKIKELFNKLALNYDKNNNIISLYLHKLIKKDAIKKLKIKENTTILDLCTGTGDIIEYILKQQNAIKKIIGIDFSSKMLKIARKRFKKEKNVKFINQNASKLPFCNSAFDYITISFGFRNIKHKIRTLKEIKRVLKPNGKIIHLDFGKSNWFINMIFEFIVNFILKLFYKKSAPYKYLLKSKEDFYSPNELIKLFELRGFILEKRVDYLFGILSMQIYKKIKLKQL
ncbi:MAG: 16S rRNA (cytosine(1402)-N(4))-methyltransferase [Candidatus Melainabacteria bacterium LEY3_CP_29_8]|nr:MAG: 16S rRNA (cytosine(1402)-N(4))-methyltransferase [Candidatus Melainabacteria bacterium LEY3_CP_29_8]